MVAPLNPFHGWSDVAHLAGWRWQVHARGGWRIQTPADRTHWSSTMCEEAAARDVWHQTIASHDLHWQEGPFLIALHGLAHQRRSLRPLVEDLQVAGYPNVIRFEYASCHGGIEQHARALDRVLSALPSGSHCDFVAHSLGNIVTRRWFGLRRDQQAAADVSGGRMVMLAPPNQGSSLARTVGGVWLFRRCTGATGQQLGRDWQSLEPDLPAPNIPFGVIAAEVPKWLLNPLLRGRSDWIVRVDETELPNAADTLVVPALHAVMMRSRDVIRATQRFLKTGRF